MGLCIIRAKQLTEVQRMDEMKISANFYKKFCHEPESSFSS